MNIPAVVNFDITKIPVEGTAEFRANASYVWSAIPNVINSYNTSILAIKGAVNEVQSNTDAVAINTSKAESAAARAESAANNENLLDSYNMDTSNVFNTAMSKATFNALANANNDKFAGSGFVEIGKGLNDGSYAAVNEGMTTRFANLVTDFSNSFIDGRISGGEGASKTVSPYVSVNGITHKLYGINSNGDFYSWANKYTLPDAPTVHPSETVLTPEQINVGVIAHADASYSGLIKNGKFDTDIDWTKGIGWSIANGVATSDGTTGDTYQISSSSFSLKSGQIALVECDIVSISSGSFAITYSTHSGSATASAYSTSGVVGKLKREIIANSDCVISIGVNQSGTVGSIDNVSVITKDAISRKDLTMLESWHEDTAEKGVLYKYGNTQTKKAIEMGTAGTFAGQDTYSLFGNWQAPNTLVGNAISITSLTFLELMEFVGNPENNCYYDGDKLIQVRYRMRVIQGVGDEWESVDPQSTTYNELAYTPSNGNILTPQGKLTLPSGVLVRGTSTNPDGAWYISSGNGNDNNFGVPNNGIYNTQPQYPPYNIAKTNIAHEGKCYALPIALVHRRNQFGYDATFNPNGTATAIGTPTVTSIADSLYYTKFNIGTSGDIVSGSTANPLGYYCDQVHESDFSPSSGGADLRSSAQVKQYKLQFEALVIRDAASDLTHYPVTTEVGLVELATDGIRYLEYSPSTKRVYYTNSTTQYQTDSFIKEGAIS